MKLLRAGLAILSLSFVTSANSAEWIGPYSISRIETDGGPVYFLKPDEITAFPNPNNCPSSLYVVYETPGKPSDRALAIGLTAKGLGKQVRYYITGCSVGGYITATSIEIW